jgi:hypothetical protein
MPEDSNDDDEGDYSDDNDDDDHHHHQCVLSKNVATIYFDMLLKLFLEWS